MCIAESERYQGQVEQGEAGAIVVPTGPGLGVVPRFAAGPGRS